MSGTASMITTSVLCRSGSHCEYRYARCDTEGSISICCEDFVVPETEPVAIGSPVGVIVSTDAKRFDAMATFYGDILSLPVRSRHVGFVNFVWGEFRLTIHVHSDVVGCAVDPDRVMINFAVADIVATYQRLADAGVTFRRPPERESWGGWIATFSDPDGNALQLLQLPG
jgi:predicted enzyme related to lactoylglutathione lyase